MTQRNLLWLATNGGVFSLAANWSDVTAAPIFAAAPPGAGDTVTMAGSSAAAASAITGGGVAYLANFTGAASLSGGYHFQTLTLGAASMGGILTLGMTGSLTLASGLIASGSVIAAGGKINAMGVTLGAGQSGIGSASAELAAVSGGTIQLGSAVLAASGANLYTDGTGAIEIGTLGGAVAGSVTIDAGFSAAGEGQVAAFGSIVNNGTIAASGGTLEIGAVGGSGMLTIGANACLMLNGRTGGSQKIVFNGANANLAIAAEIDSPAGTVAGFAAGDAIDMLGSPITGAHYTAASASSGTLTLTYAGQVAARLILQGSYGGDVFLTAGDGALGTLITMAPAPSGSGSISPGTVNPDTYSWIAAGSGAWNQAENWRDVTTGASPAAVAPGQNNLVGIIGASTGFSVIGGNARAQSLGITGGVATTGSISAQTLAIGFVSAPLASGTAGTLDILAGSAITAAGAAIADGAISVAGSNALLTIAGTLSLGGGASGVGLPVSVLSAGEGAMVTLGGLTMGGGAGDNVTTDMVSSIEIGTRGGASAGAVTIDAGFTLTGNGTLNAFGKVIDNGSIVAASGGLTLGQVSGAGGLAIAVGATLELRAQTTLGVSFQGSLSTLCFASELDAHIGTISGFQAGDVIDFAQDPISAVNFTNNGGSGGVLTLSYNGQVVTALTLSGNFAGQHFYLLPDAVSGTEIALAANSSTGGSVAQGSSDLLSWSNPVAGAWSRAANWSDLTTGTIATSAPGTQSDVEINGASGGDFVTIGGPGGATTLSLTGNIVFDGAFSVTTLSVGTAASAAAILLQPGGSLAASVAAIDNASISIGTNNAFSVTGTAMLGLASDAIGNATTLSVANHGFSQLAAVNLAGNTVLTSDGSGTLEIGTLGGAAGGAITIDAGAILAGAGSVNSHGVVKDNGTVTAFGGTLIAGSVSGGGVLDIGQNAALALAGADSCPVNFTGAGGELILAGEAFPSGLISGFVAGDMIVLANEQIGSVSYAPSANNTGILSLFYGASLLGNLQLSGNFLQGGFSVATSGTSSAIVFTPASGGVSPGTVSPDQYQWSGAASTDWGVAQNWVDTTQGQNPAAIAPGLNDSVTI
jgi:hypothetical protein